MTKKQRDKITKIAQEFYSGFQDTFPTINGTGFLIVDPLSGYLSFEGYEHTVSQIPAKGDRPQVLLLDFPDGSTFIPAGEDLKGMLSKASNWMWILKEADE